MENEGEALSSEASKLKRRASAWWLLATDKALRECTGEGWERAASEATTKPATAWPVDTSDKTKMPRLIFVANDQHSVGMSAGYYLRGKQKLFVHTLSDESHRLNNDILGACRGSSKFWPAMVMIAMTYTINFGPWDGHKFFNEIQECAKSFFGKSWENNELFLYFLPDIADDLGATAHELVSATWAKQRWLDLADGPVTQSKGPRLNFSRWGSWFDCQRYWDRHWHSRLVVMLVWGLQMGYVKENLTNLIQKVQAKRVARQPPPTAEGGKPKTRFAKNQAILRSLKDASKNQLHCATLVLLMPGLQRLTRMVAACGGPLRLQHGLQARDNRDPKANSQYFTKQALGDSVNYLYDVLRCLYAPRTLQDCKFAKVVSALPAGVADSDHNYFHEERDLYAKWMGLGFEMVLFRVRSSIHYLRGYPGHFAALLTDDELVRSMVLSDLENDWALWKEALEQIDAVGVQKIVQNSYMAEPFVRRAFEILEAVGFFHVPLELRQALEDMHSLPVTKPVEDYFHHARVQEDRCQANRRMTPHRMWFTCLHKSILSGVHNYAEVDYNQCPLEVARSFPRQPRRETFDPAKGTDPWQMLGNIANTSDPTWPTYTPESSVSRVADLKLLEVASLEGSWAIIQDAWLCKLFLPAMLVRRSETQTCWFVLGLMGSTAALGWLAETCEVGGELLYRPCLDRPTGQRPWELLCVLDVASWQALGYRWITPADHAFACSQPSGALGPPSRSGWAIAVREWDTLKREAAMLGFGRLNTTTVTMLCKHFKVDVRSKSSFVDKLVALLVACLPDFTTEQIAEILLARLQEVEQDEDVALLQSEEFKSCFDPSDWKVVDAAADKAEQNDDLDGRFKKGLHDWLDEHHNKRAAKRLCKKGPPPPGEPMPAELPRPEAPYTEAEAAAYMPNANWRVWVDAEANRIQVRHKTLGSKSRSWVEHGYDGALGQVANYAYDKEAWSRGVPNENPHTWMKEFPWDDSSIG